MFTCGISPDKQELLLSNLIATSLGMHMIKYNDNFDQ